MKQTNPIILYSLCTTNLLQEAIKYAKLDDRVVIYYDPYDTKNQIKEIIDQQTLSIPCIKETKQHQEYGWYRKFDKKRF